MGHTDPTVMDVPTSVDVDGVAVTLNPPVAAGVYVYHTSASVVAHPPVIAEPVELMTVPLWAEPRTSAIAPTQSSLPGIGGWGHEFGEQRVPTPWKVLPAAQPDKVEREQTPLASLQQAPCPHGFAAQAVPAPRNVLPLAGQPSEAVSEHAPEVVLQHAPCPHGLEEHTTPSP
jgi:hypothetical protein